MYRPCPGCGRLVMHDLALDGISRPWHRECLEQWQTRRQDPDQAPDPEDV